MNVAVTAAMNAQPSFHSLVTEVHELKKYPLEIGDHRGGGDAGLFIFHAHFQGSTISVKIFVLMEMTTTFSQTCSVESSASLYTLV